MLNNLLVILIYHIVNHSHRHKILVISQLRMLTIVNHLIQKETNKRQLMKIIFTNKIIKLTLHLNKISDILMSDPTLLNNITPIHSLINYLKTQINGAEIQPHIFLHLHCSIANNFNLFNINPQIKIKHNLQIHLKNIHKNVLLIILILFQTDQKAG